VLQLRSGHWTVEIDEQGAQLSRLRDAEGRDLLWNGDAAFWSGRAPILFPIVGALNGGHYTWRGQRYVLPRHGLARTRRFEVVRETDHEAVFRLCADADTVKIYPFQFELNVAFRIEGTTLEIEAGVRNLGDEPMPASLGFHPAFRWPLPYGAARGAHFIEFAFDELAPIRRLDAAGLLTDARHPSPVRQRRLALDDSLFAEDVVIFDQLESSQLRYGADSGPKLTVSFPGATHLGLWTKPGAGFICIEPWRGVADPVGFDDGFAAKPGLFTVQPGGTGTLLMRLDLDADATDSFKTRDLPVTDAAPTGRKK